MGVKIDPKEKNEEGLRKQWNGYKISTNSYWMARTYALPSPQTGKKSAYLVRLRCWPSVNASLHLKKI